MPRAWRLPRRPAEWSLDRRPSVEKCVEEKKDFAARGKAEVQQWNEEIASERNHTMEMRKQHALEIKQSKMGKVRAA